MSSLRGYQHWATLGLINDIPGQQDILDILRNIRADFPNKLNLQSAPNCARLRRAISRRIREMPANIPLLHRDETAEALYELFKLCRSDWSATTTRSVRIAEVSGGDCEDNSDNESDSSFVWDDLGNRGSPFTELSSGSDSVSATDTASLGIQASDSNEEYARQRHGSVYTHADSVSGHRSTGDDMNMQTAEHSHETAQTEATPWKQKLHHHEWGWFNYQHTYVIFNAFVDITWTRYPRYRESIRLSDMMGTSTDTFHAGTPFPRTRQQDRSPDGDWIRLDSVSLYKLLKQLQVSRSSDQHKDAIGWSSSALATTDVNSTEGQVRIDNLRDLTWAVCRSFDAPWQDWRGRRIGATRPSQENYPRFSIIIREVDDLVDTSESMDLDDDRSRYSGFSICGLLEGIDGCGESVCGDDLADILSAIIKEPLRPNDWALSLLSFPMDCSSVFR
jgi:hypothetical protein